jgi:membrane-associated phospholipid phosphatase
MHDPLAEIVPIKNRRAWRDLARILSTVFNPFLTALALFVILAHATARSTTDFWWLLFVSTFFTSTGPMLYGTDRISDLDMSVRHEREAVFGAFVVFYLLGTVALWLVHAPQLMIASMAAYTVSTLIVQYITRYWKISTHALGITAPIVVLTLLFGTQVLPFAILIPLVGWARIYLKAHTPLQVIAGCVLAFVSVMLFFRLFHVKEMLTL